MKDPSSSSFYLCESLTKMSDEEETEPIQLGKRTLDAIIEGVAAKLRENPPSGKRSKDGSGPSSAGKGEQLPPAKTSPTFPSPPVWV